MVGVVPAFVEDAGSWAAAFAAVAGAAMLVARAVRTTIERVIAPELEAVRGSLHRVDGKIDQLSADNSAQHAANANAAAARDAQINGRIDTLTDELRQAGERFDRRITGIEETVADHIANRYAHQPGSVR